MPINAATTYLTYANLQMAAEAWLDRFPYTTQAGLQAALEFGNNRASVFIPTQAARFAAEWKVLDHRADTGTGVSGTPYEYIGNNSDPVLKDNDWLEAEDGNVDPNADDANGQLSAEWHGGNAVHHTKWRIAA